MIEKYFTTPFSVSVYTESKSNGTIKTSYTSGYSGFCHIDPLSVAIKFESDKIKALATHRLFTTYLPTQIKPLDLVVVETKTYKVLQVLNAAGMGYHTEVTLEG